jgi:hypothetical protein
LRGPSRPLPAAASAELATRLGPEPAPPARCPREHVSSAKIVISWTVSLDRHAARLVLGELRDGVERGVSQEVHGGRRAVERDETAPRVISGVTRETGGRHER